MLIERKFLNMKYDWIGDIEIDDDVIAHADSGLCAVCISIRDLSFGDLKNQISRLTSVNEAWKLLVEFQKEHKSMKTHDFINFFTEIVKDTYLNDRCRVDPKDDEFVPVCYQGRPWESISIKYIEPDVASRIIKLLTDGK